MNIRTLFNPGSRVCWISDDCGEVLRGEVDEVIARKSKDANATVNYALLSDKEIKGSNVHIISEGELYPETYYQTLCHMYDRSRGIQN